MPARPIFYLGLAAALCLPSAGADILRLPEGQRQVIQAPWTPPRGMDRDTVLRRYGEPQSRQPAVGDPPISRWVYPGFTVVFEGRYVLHTVVQAPAQRSPSPDAEP
ncbi:hypothetical protein SAMN05421721_103157 [Ectothiorhodospira mobilis]|uniref:Nickel/cobalt transporter regulator n=1 Tax=Ectothiorhodospira mobilis TaxID=195064 RepID=A0A1I4Q519_ECTMO|nr:hypothetical protein [Ectothiorhodospira mobilis]SFM35171.1 hypothetical protein SAMN05421721_103157 [Ectothiorhodospira mobilis]